ncbi:unnamed protein product [Brassicogethes aeneus]|uniref:Photoreceptor outer segment membrane glycoprotein 2 n=1 Tax=Brassicogethes aeneus TaxID=1431903 RepID=A0A9P0B3W5_BRAAE|nr:unnamed protein product [Brassicogethes aeneus]
MAIGTVILSAKKRCNLLYIISALCIIQALIGGAITGPSIYIYVSIAPIVSGDSAEIKFVFATTGIFGTHVIFDWLIGISVGRRCFSNAKKKSTRNLLLIWCCTGSNTIINLIIIASLTKKLNKQIGRSMKNSLQSSMRNYLRDESVKMSMDELQYYEKCCGIYSYEDWHELSWLSKYEIDVNSEGFKRYREGDENVHLPIVPWSCCKLEFPTQCLHDPLQQTMNAHLWKNEPNIVTDSINANGCLDIVWKPITKILAVFAVLISISTILHIIIFCLMRILYTSCRNLYLLPDQKGLSPGWVFGRGDCGYFRGKTLNEIMMGIDQSGPPEDRSEKSGKKHLMAFRSLKAIMSKNKKTKKERPEEEKLMNESTSPSFFSATTRGTFNTSEKNTIPDTDVLLYLK